MRSHTLFSEDRHCVFPGDHFATSPDTVFTSAMSLKFDAIPHYWLTKRYRLRIDFAIDPAVSLTGSSVYTLEMDLTRPLPVSAPQLEIALIEGLFDWPGSFSIPGRDDVFLSLALDGTFSMFHDGWIIPGDPGGPAEDNVRASYRFLIRGPYNDSEFIISTDPLASLSPPVPGGSDTVTALVNIAPPTPGPAIVTSCTFIDTGGSPSPYFFGGPPVLTLTPAECYPRNRRDGSSPMHDTATFALLGNPYETKT